MSQWVDRFNNHAIHQQLKTLQSTLLQLEELSPDTTEAIERLKQIQELATKSLATLDPALAPLGVLNNLSSQVQQIISYCNQYQSTRDAGHLTNANNNADAVLMQLGGLPTLRNVEDVESLGEAITSLRRSVGQYHRYVDDERKGIQAQIEAAKGTLKDLENNITTQQTRLDEIASEFQKQFSESEERRRTEFAESEKDYENRFRELQENLESKFREFSQRVALTLAHP